MKGAVYGLTNCCCELTSMKTWGAFAFPGYNFKIMEYKIDQTTLFVRLCSYNTMRMTNLVFHDDQKEKKWHQNCRSCVVNWVPFVVVSLQHACTTSAIAVCSIFTEIGWDSVMGWKIQDLFQCTQFLGRYDLRHVCLCKWHYITYIFADFYLLLVVVLTIPNWTW